MASNVIRELQICSNHSVIITHTHNFVLSIHFFHYQLEWQLAPEGLALSFYIFRFLSRSNQNIELYWVITQYIDKTFIQQTIQ